MRDRILWRSFVIALVLFLASWSVACNPAPSVGCRVGNQAPDFTLKNLNGEDVSLSNYPGKLVILHFWYRECEPCITEMRYLQKAYNNWSSEGGPVLLTVCTKGRASDVSMWMASNQYTLPVLIDQEGIVVKKYCIFGCPTTIFIDPAGTIQKVKLGPFYSEKEIEKILGSLQ